MRITILADGLRDDVRPLLALGRGLQGRGHAVRLVADPNLADWIESFGLEAAPSEGSILAWWKQAATKAAQVPARFPSQALALLPLVSQGGMRMLNAVWAACQDAEAIISGPWSDVYAASIAEKTRSAHINALLHPALLATYSGLAAVEAPLPTRVSILNYLYSKWRIRPLPWKLMGAASNHFRQETLGLPAQTPAQNAQALQQMLVVQGYSAHVIPHPEDVPANIHTCGYWFLDEQPGLRPPDLMDFLAAGDPPVLIAAHGADWSPGLVRLLLDALQLSGQRAILALEPGVQAALRPQDSQRIYCLASAAPAWLFECAQAVVHSGQASLTAECLRAGAPGVVLPGLADQPLWAGRVADLGAGPAMLPFDRLTAENLAAALRAAANDADIRQCAAVLGARIRAEDGTRAALDLIENYLRQTG